MSLRIGGQQKSSSLRTSSDNENTGGITASAMTSAPSAPPNTTSAGGGGGNISSGISFAVPPTTSTSSGGNNNNNTSPYGPRTTSSASIRASQRSMASTASTRSTSHRTLNFFRYIVGVRNADYCSDAPPPPGLREATSTGSQRGVGGPSVRSLLSVDGPNDSLTGGGQQLQQEQQVPAWKRYLLCCSCLNISCPTSSARRQLFLSILQSRAWRALLLVLTFILLFGAQIRNCAIPASGDAAADAVFMATFVLFWIDIFMRIDAVPNYFAFNLCGFPASGPGAKSLEDEETTTGGGSGVAGSNSTGGVADAAGENSSSLKSSSDYDDGANRTKGGGGCCGIEIGSFLFWCDVVSTLTLLYDISFINTDNFSQIQVLIALDQFGVPRSGLESINRASPIELETDLLVTIGRTARAARFIRSSTAVKISSKVNWDWFFNIINPFWWCRICRRSLLPEREAKKKSSNSTHSEYNDFRSSQMAGGTGGGGGDGVTNPTTTHSPRTQAGSNTMLLRNSWGGLNIAMVAIVRTEQAKAKQRKGLLSAPKRLLSYMGIIPSYEASEMLRQVAAIKIQRAWRRAYPGGAAAAAAREEKRANSEQAQDVAWEGHKNPRADMSNPVEHALQKRSFLKRYSTMNRRNIKATSPTTAATAVANSQGRNRLSRIPLGSSSSTASKRRNESQVGSAMRELTGQRVAIGIIIALVLTVLFTYTENDATWPSTMIVLHHQTGYPAFADKSLNAARNSSVPDLFLYELANGDTRYYDIDEIGGNASTLRPREIYNVTVHSTFDNSTTVGLFAFRDERREQALVSVLSTFFILIVWFAGVTAFAGPVMVLVVIPIERMVRLLGMLMVDPLGYENSPRYRRFIEDENSIAQNTRWTKEVLKGMETSFLMSTILRIGSLMKVGFGSAGVEIIRNHLKKGQNKNMLMLSEKGSSVSCIFLFCDIRQFTDATECLQEEVFVFTNRIAAVVHKYCHAYGGSANKNIGDAFLCSWLLDEEPVTSKGGVSSSYNGGFGMGGGDKENFTANTNQADKALLSVVKISMALHYDDFYIEPLSSGARDALRSKLSKRKGPVVQMGFGIHAGKAVQGAIGSQRKIDATYVSEHVERAEFLESSTKKYGVKMLMSDSFHRLLHPSNRRRCRKIDQILIQDEEDAEDDYVSADGKIIELLTFDMDIDALWKNKGKKQGGEGESDSEKGSEKGGGVPSNSMNKREGVNSLRGSGAMLMASRRRSMLQFGSTALNISDEFSENFGSGTPANQAGDHHHDGNDSGGGPPELILPDGPALYNANVWLSEEMRKIRLLYSDGLFFQKFNSGLQAFYARDWEHAKQCFVTILDSFEDGPSRYFMGKIKANNGVPPRDFKPYGIA